MSDFLTDNECFIREGLSAAFKDSPQLFNRPIVPATLLVSGSLAGFSDDVAEAILGDPDSEVYLNELWNVYFEETGLDLPSGIQLVIDNERAGIGPQWNLRVAHAAGRGWTEDEFDSQIEQLLASLPYTHDVRVPVGVRGATNQAQLESADLATPYQWDSYFLTQHFLILQRYQESSLIGQIESATVSGRFLLTLEWPGAVSRTVVVTIVRGQRRPSTFSIENAPTGLPTKASIKVCREMG